MSEVKKPAAKKSTGKGRTKPKKSVRGNRRKSNQLRVIQLIRH